MSGMQDALGRSALMFAAGNCAQAALLALLAAGATLGLRDRRNRSVLDYAPEGSKVKQQLQDRCVHGSPPLSSTLFLEAVDRVKALCQLDSIAPASFLCLHVTFGCP